MMNLKTLAVIGTLGISSCCGYFAWRAQSNLVTLHVRNAPIADVVSSLRWQTWEKIILHTNVTGRVTLDVRKMPLNNVLALIGEQVNARWTAVFPIYREKTALVSLERALRGEVEFANTAFTNFQAQPMGGRGEPGSREARPVTVNFQNTDLTISALALERFGGGQIVIEKNQAAKISLALAETPFEKAVAKVARAARRSTTRLYALQPVRTPRMMAGPPGENRPRPEQTRDPEAEAQRNEAMRQVLLTLPAEEQKKAEERQIERTAMQSLTPEQREQVMTERANSPEMQARAEQRSASGIKNSTPEQRRERYERMYQMRKARAAATRNS